MSPYAGTKSKYTCGLTQVDCSVGNQEYVSKPKDIDGEMASLFAYSVLPEKVKLLQIFVFITQG